MALIKQLNMKLKVVFLGKLLSNCLQTCMIVKHTLTVTHPRSCLKNYVFDFGINYKK